MKHELTPPPIVECPIVSSAPRFRQYLHMQDFLALGPQFRAPNLRDALAHARLPGPVAAITAGWQEREGELEALEQHLAAPVRDLRLYERAEAVFAQDAELHAAYRSRQTELRRLQDLYRIRLDHAKAAARDLQRSQDGTPLARQALRSAIAALRRLDTGHLRNLRAIHARFEQQWSADQHPLLAGQRAEIEHILDSAGVVCIAGGHVAVLLNRLRLFGLGRALRTKAVVAWSAGAMAMAERVVLFHDHPPQGAGNAELFEAGLGLVAGTVFLPHSASRLAIENRERVALLARRLAPSIACTLDDGDRLHWHRGRLVDAQGSRRLLASGAAVSAGARP
jgi:hypothetical protein